MPKTSLPLRRIVPLGGLGLALGLAACGETLAEPGSTNPADRAAVEQGSSGSEPPSTVTSKSILIDPPMMVGCGGSPRPGLSCPASTIKVRLWPSTCAVESTR